MLGNHCIKCWSKTLPVLALSSGEAELMSAVRGTIEAKGLRSLMRDVGTDTKLEMHSDAIAGIGIASRYRP